MRILMNNLIMLVMEDLSADGYESCREYKKISPWYDCPLWVVVSY